MGYGYVRFKRLLDTGQKVPGSVNNPIVIGDEWRQEITITDPEQEIVLATAGTPVTITTRFPHGIVNNDYVKIRETPESPALQGIWKAINVTGTTLQLENSVGVAVAKGGVIAKCNDGSSCVVSGKLRLADGTEIDTFNVNWITQARFNFSLDFSDTETTALAAYAGQTAYFALKVIDSLGKDSTLLKGEIDIVKTTNY